MSRNIRSYLATGLAVAGVGLIGNAVIPRAHADEWNKRTIVHVQEPIIVGNRVLEPGTYVWRLLDSPADRHIVQVFDGTGQHLETTVLANSNYRLTPSGHTQFTFWETPANVPKAVHAWFYPGDNFGQEFPYPKKLVAQLASTQPVPVPATYSEPASQPAPEPQSEAAPAPAPEPQQVPAQQNTTSTQTDTSTAANAPAAAPQSLPASLPHTGTENLLYAMFGAASLGTAAVLTIAERNKIKQNVRKS